MEERDALMREFARLDSKTMDPDFSGMSEADRAAEAERLRQEALEEARRLKMAGDPSFRARECEARIIDFDPKQEGMYFNRLFFVDLATFEHDEELEATLAAKVLRGKFHGTITAHTTSIQERIVLYDSKVAVGHGVIRLMRRVVSVCVEDMLIIEANTSCGKSVRVEFAPRGNSGDEDVITVGATEMRVMVAWSIMYP
ncbi:hypothetical protein BAE44_0020515 [Dichanthelium oligosanthes]|uniref:DUF6598 domain-containing protein n=1 Tax=Dichanthelium oligosanthes TaxID=888268 RepID=A0A1E5UZZ1_9POAL|nr:hypothetical protein BAE44_0020515 [Dichanthelium oligosanthes]